jgi:transcriptional regulator with XRE-family HTH domain
MPPTPGRPHHDVEENAWNLVYMGRLVRALRHDRGETREQLCTALGISATTLQSLEQGHGLYVRKLPTLARHFDISLDMLLGMDREPQAHALSA